MNKDNLKWHEGKVSYEERCRLLGQRGLVVWFTGLPGSGKSTIAVEVEKALIDGRKLVFRLDGDNIRHGLNSDLGFSEADRLENIRRVAEVAALFCEAGLIVLVSFITPYRKMRQMAKTKIGPGQMIEVFVKASSETCARRDPKKLYQKANRGELADFTGVSAPYEEPEEPDLVLDTEQLTPQQAAELVVNAALERSTIKT